MRGRSERAATRGGLASLAWGVVGTVGVVAAARALVSLYGFLPVGAVPGEWRPWIALAAGAPVALVGLWLLGGGDPPTEIRRYLAVGAVLTAVAAVASVRARPARGGDGTAALVSGVGLVVGPWLVACVAVAASSDADALRRVLGDPTESVRSTFATVCYALAGMYLLGVALGGAFAFSVASTALTGVVRTGRPSPVGLLEPALAALAPGVALLVAGAASADRGPSTFSVAHARLFQGVAVAALVGALAAVPGTVLGVVVGSPVSFGVGSLLAGLFVGTALLYATILAVLAEGTVRAVAGPWRRRGRPGGDQS